VSGIDPLVFPADHLGPADEQVDDTGPSDIAALGQHGRSRSRRKRSRALLRLAGSMAAQDRQFRCIGRDERRHLHQPLERSDRRFVRKDGAARRDHDRIENDWNIAEALQPPGHRGSRFGGSDHADLDRIGADIGKHHVDLLQHHVGRNGMYRLDAERVLGRDGGDRRHRVAAKHRHRLDVGLDAGAAAAVGAGNDQDTGWLHARSHAQHRAIGQAPGRIRPLP
jgi:hypothetical protein